MHRLTFNEARVLEKLLNDCLRSKKGIGAICRDDWFLAESLVEMGLVEYQALLTDRAWWVTDRGVDAVNYG